MYTKTMLIGMLIGLFAMVGCVSLEGTRQQLLSNNKEKIRDAEDTIYSIATEGVDPFGIVKFKLEDRIKYVSLTSNNDLLLKIIEGCYDDDSAKVMRDVDSDKIVLAAANRLDLSKREFVKKLLLKKMDLVKRVEESFDVLNDRCLYDKAQTQIKSNQFRMKLFSSLTGDELIQVLKSLIKERYGVGELIQDIVYYLFENAKECNELAEIFMDEFRYFHDLDRDKPRLFQGFIRRSVVEVLSEETVKKLLCSDQVHEYLTPYSRVKLYLRLPESQAVECMLRNVGKYSLFNHRNDLLTDAALYAQEPIDPKSIVRILSAVLKKLEVGTEGIKKVGFLISKFPKLSDGSTNYLSESDLSEGRVVLTDRAAKDILDRIDDEEFLAEQACYSPIYAIRAAAIARVENESVLSKIVCDEIERVDVYCEPKNVDKNDLKKLAIGNIKGTNCLCSLREKCASKEIKKAVTKRLIELGWSDVEKICKYDKYDTYLSILIEGVKSKPDLELIARSAKLKGIRLLAASKLDDTTYRSVAQKEVATNDCKPEKGKLVVCGYYLGMNIDDMYAKLAVDYPEIKLKLWFSDNIVSILDANIDMDKECDNTEGLIAFTTNKPDVYEGVVAIRFLPLMVKRMVGFKEGSFEDLQCAVFNKLGISLFSLKDDSLQMGDISQDVSRWDNTEGETLLYYIGQMKFGVNVSRRVRKAFNEYNCSGTRNKIGNLFEDAQQAKENLDYLKKANELFMFHPQGSLFLGLTKYVDGIIMKSSFNNSLFGF